MNRRKSIKKIALATGSMVVLPAWARGWSKQSLDLTDSIFNPKEEKMLTALADAMIPQGDSIGALSVGVDKFLQRLFSDCYETEVQDKLKSQLHQIAQKAQNDYGLSFENCQQPQRMSIMEQFACSDDQETRETFELIKNETIRGFRTSKEVMTEYLEYELIPGHFYGCIEVNS